jgi:hypothetical protein
MHTPLRLPAPRLQPFPPAARPTSSARQPAASRSRSCTQAASSAYSASAWASAGRVVGRTPQPATTRSSSSCVGEYRREGVRSACEGAWEACGGHWRRALRMGGPHVAARHHPGQQQLRKGRVRRAREGGCAEGLGKPCRGMLCGLRRPRAIDQARTHLHAHELVVHEHPVGVVHSQPRQLGHAQAVARHGRPVRERVLDGPWSGGTAGSRG